MILQHYALSEYVSPTVRARIIIARSPRRHWFNHTRHSHTFRSGQLCILIMSAQSACGGWGWAFSHSQPFCHLRIIKESACVCANTPAPVFLKSGPPINSHVLRKHVDCAFSSIRHRALTTPTPRTVPSKFHVGNGVVGGRSPASRQTSA